jgi:GMP synthase-like glutamine amidotransferase
MSVLILKNMSHEGPGTIEDCLRTIKLPYKIADLYRGESLPDAEHFSHLVILGGPMAVYEMDSYPFLKEEAVFIEKAINAGKYILGICLGAQMLAHVLGAKVYRGAKKEIGWYEVSLTADGLNDHIMSELSINSKTAAEVFQWHGDTFDLPDGTVRLASSELYLNQAFRFSGRIYALQFHIEITPEIVEEWMAAEKDVDLHEMVSDTRRRFAAYHKRAKGFYRKFFTSPLTI